LRECVLDVALGNVGFEDDVAVPATIDGLDVGGEAFVDERRVARECRAGGQHAAQWFVVDLDRGGRADRRLGVDGRDGRDRLADIADLSRASIVSSLTIPPQCVPAISAPVMIACTPGSARAALVRQATMRACACWLV
jgi:hypothetical protein